MANSTKKRHYSKRRTTIVALLAAIVAIALFFTIQHMIQARQDAHRFTTLNKQQSAVTDRLIEEVGDKFESSREANICFNTEQGPWDNGHLWCQTATIVQLKGDVDFKKLGEQFVSIARDGGLVAHAVVSYGVPSFWFDAEGVPCDYGYVSTSGDEVSAGTSDALYNVDPPAFAVACSGRAKAKHYPYVN